MRPRPSRSPPCTAAAGRSSSCSAPSRPRASTSRRCASARTPPGRSSPWRPLSPRSPSSSSSTPATAAPAKAASGPSPTPSTLTTCPSSKPCAKASKAGPNDNATPTPGARSPMRHGSAPASADGPATTASPDPSSCSRAGSSSKPPNAAPPSSPRNAMCESASPFGRGVYAASSAGAFSWCLLSAGLPGRSLLSAGLGARRRSLGAAARGAARLLRRSRRTPRVDERDRLVERHGVGAERAWERCVDLAVGDVGAEAAGLDHDGLAGARLLAERAARVALAAAAVDGAAFLRDDEVDRAVGADRQHVVVLLEVGVGLGVLDVGAVAADADEDRRARLRVRRDRLRQGEQPQRPLEVDRRRIGARWQRRALRLVALLDRLAELEEHAEAAVAQRHGQAGLRVLAEELHAGRA